MAFARIFHSSLASGKEQVPEHLATFLTASLHPGFWRRNEPLDSSEVTSSPWSCNLVPVGLTGSCSFPRIKPWEPQRGVCSSPKPGQGSVCTTTLGMLHRKSTQQLQRFQRNSQLCSRWDIGTGCAALLRASPLGFDSCASSCAGTQTGLRRAQKHPSSAKNSPRKCKSARPPELPLGRGQQTAATWERFEQEQQKGGETWGKGCRQGSSIPSSCSSPANPVPESRTTLGQYLNHNPTTSGKKFAFKHNNVV